MRLSLLNAYRAFSIRADMQLHAEVALVALLGLAHRGTTLAFPVLGRTGGGNQRGIDNRAARELHAIGQQQRPHPGEQGFAKLVLLQQVAEVKQGRGIRHPLSSQIDFAEVAERGNVVEGVFAGFVRQVEPVGDTVHAQHPLQTHRRATVPRLRAVRSISVQNSAHGIRPSMRARNSALRVGRMCFSNPAPVASVICFIVLSLVVRPLRLTLWRRNRSQRFLLVQIFP